MRRGQRQKVRVLTSSGVAGPNQIISAAYASAAIFSWGTSDFLGGYCTRRANAFLFTAIVNVGGLVLVGILACASGTPFPSPGNAAWVLAGGMSGGMGLAIFYRALSSGKMGLTAPVAAVLGAAIPTLFSIFTEGMPGVTPLIGFACAAIGLWLITRTDNGLAAEGIGLAVLAGIGFSGFYLGVRQAGDASVYWIALLSRCGGLLITGIIALSQRRFKEIDARGVYWALFTGCLDSLGTLLFIRASQTGRLDKAVVISSLYPAVTVILARVVLKEQFSRWKVVGLVMALAAVPMIAGG